MKIVAVLGSPKKDSVSSAIAKEVLRGAEEAGHDIVIYNINDMNIKGCQACGYCKKHHVDCILEDDLSQYWKDLHECGALILASPNYCAQVSGPMITFMNRHYCLMMSDGPRIKPGIKLVGVFSQGNRKQDAVVCVVRIYLGIRGAPEKADGFSRNAFRDSKKAFHDWQVFLSFFSQCRIDITDQKVR